MAAGLLRSSVTQPGAPKLGYSQIFINPLIAGNFCRLTEISESLQVAQQLPSDGHWFGDSLYSWSRTRFRNRIRARLVPVHLAHRNVGRRKRTLKMRDY